MITCVCNYSQVDSSSKYCKYRPALYAMGSNFMYARDYVLFLGTLFFKHGNRPEEKDSVCPLGLTEFLKTKQPGAIKKSMAKQSRIKSLIVFISTLKYATFSACTVLQKIVLFLKAA